MNNIYIQTLKLGFENPEGISFNEVVERLEIGLKANLSSIFYRQAKAWRKIMVTAQFISFSI